MSFNYNIFVYNFSGALPKSVEIDYKDSTGDQTVTADPVPGLASALDSYSTISFVSDTAITNTQISVTNPKTSTVQTHDLTFDDSGSAYLYLMASIALSTAGALVENTYGTNVPEGMAAIIYGSGTAWTALDASQVDLTTGGVSPLVIVMALEDRSYYEAYGLPSDGMSWWIWVMIIAAVIVAIVVFILIIYLLFK